MEFPAYKSELLSYRVEKTEALVPYARNARTHSDEQIGKLMASIREFGFTNPVLIDGERGIIAGHGRVLAAQRLGMAEVPVIELTHLSAAQRRAYVIADNRLAMDAGWDPELLSVEIGDLRTEGFDLALTGFELGELREIILPGLDAKKGAEKSLGEDLKYQVVIECSDEADQAALLETLKADGRSCRPLIL